MAEFRRQWDDGDSLSATYDGNGDGIATFSSDVDEGLDREMNIRFSDTQGRVFVERKVKQEGKREVFEDFIVTDGTFNVLKDGLQ